MTTISVQPKDRLEGTSNFNTWKVRVFNILEKHDLDCYVSFMVEEPRTNEECINLNKNLAKSKQIIYDSVKDNLMFVITSLKTSMELFDTLTNLYEKKASSQKRALKNKL